MGLAARLSAGAARLLFYPTLLYTAARARLPGSRRPWFHRIDGTVLLGALPLRGRSRRLVAEENVRAVVTLNEEYETRFLCCSAQEWEAMGVEQLRLSTVDLTGVLTLENLHKGVEFIMKHQLHHWSPQEAIEAITKIRPHILVRHKQVQVLEMFHRNVITEITAECQ
ncbi:phosphatidylglycerophosphatase and protein-tyrosine phosphatase 1 isoform X2 [Phalacrocorax aristotelis]|uniref:phosphatidylglycerophosphatase and protein-tyrosine phosphatase 1 isoform X2 n=1 Tax=Phalacrocorax aristotelis TaxID=126867 RepID=UPI003F4CA2DB